MGRREEANKEDGCMDSGDRNYGIEWKNGKRRGVEGTGEGGE